MGGAPTKMVPLVLTHNHIFVAYIDLHDYDGRTKRHFGFWAVLTRSRARDWSPGLITPS